MMKILLFCGQSIDLFIYSTAQTTPDESKFLGILPRNLEQAWRLPITPMRNSTNGFDGTAGSGKTLLALGMAFK